MSLNLIIFGVCSLVLGVAVVLGTADLRLPANNQGYTPAQPIEYSHRLHAGELAIDCQYCHYGARSSRNAGIPPASICMNCHKVVTSSYDALLTEDVNAEREGRAAVPIISAKLKPLYDALALDDKLEPRPDVAPTPIEWVRVHNLPDFVYFDHRPHVARKIACETCHGPVQGMERMRQENDLSMGWCIQCHRTTPFEAGIRPGAGGGGGRVADHVSTNCSTCHL